MPDTDDLVNFLERYDHRNSSMPRKMAWHRELAAALVEQGLFTPALSEEWGTVYEADEKTELIDPAASYDAATAIVDESPTDTGLLRRLVTEWKPAERRA